MNKKMLAPGLCAVAILGASPMLSPAFAADSTAVSAPATNAVSSVTLSTIDGVTKSVVTDAQYKVTVCGPVEAKWYCGTADVAALSDLSKLNDNVSTNALVKNTIESKNDTNAKENTISISQNVSPEGYDANSYELNLGSSSGVWTKVSAEDLQNVQTSLDNEVLKANFINEKSVVSSKPKTMMVRMAAAPAPVPLAKTATSDPTIAPNRVTAAGTVSTPTPNRVTAAADSPSETTTPTEEPTTEPTPTPTSSAKAVDDDAVADLGKMVSGDTLTIDVLKNDIADKKFVNGTLLLSTSLDGEYSDTVTTDVGTFSVVKDSVVFTLTNTSYNGNIDPVFYQVVNDDEAGTVVRASFVLTMQQAEPTKTPDPTSTPTPEPTTAPTPKPTADPTTAPTPKPTADPSTKGSTTVTTPKGSTTAPTKTGTSGTKNGTVTYTTNPTVNQKLNNVGGSGLNATQVTATIVTKSPVVKTQTDSNGTVTQVHKDGAVTTRTTDGTISTKTSDGTFVTTTPTGQTITKTSDGTIVSNNGTTTSVQSSDGTNNSVSNAEVNRTVNAGAEIQLNKNFGLAGTGFAGIAATIAYLLSVVKRVKRETI